MKFKYTDQEVKVSIIDSRQKPPRPRLVRGFSLPNCLVFPDSCRPAYDGHNTSVI